MNENFLIDNTTISTLRLRGSYGTNGNAGIGRNLYQNLLGTDRYNGETGFVPTQLGDKIIFYSSVLFYKFWFFK